MKLLMIFLLIRATKLKQINNIKENNISENIYLNGQIDWSKDQF